MVIALRLVMKEPNLLTKSCMSAATWDMRRSVRVCRWSGIAMLSVFRLPAIRVRGCFFGLCARPAIVPRVTAFGNMT